MICSTHTHHTHKRAAVYLCYLCTRRDALHTRTHTLTSQMLSHFLVSNAVRTDGTYILVTNQRGSWSAPNQGVNGSLTDEDE